MELKDKITFIKNQIEKTGKKNIFILPVSKHMNLEEIGSLYELGFSHFAENYVQSYLEKKEQCFTPIHWHFIGTLQSNKIKFLVGNVHLIQSLDNLSHSQKISEISLAQHGTQDVLIQVNIAKEKNKSGCEPEEVFHLCEKINLLKGIRLRGLMGFPPYLKEEKKIRFYFKKMKLLFDQLKNLNAHFDLLSMGTSHDYLLAIEEGSNMIRLGRIFKESYK